MTEINPDVLARLDELSRRLTEIERRIGVVPATPAATTEAAFPDVASVERPVEAAAAPAVRSEAETPEPPRTPVPRVVNAIPPPAPRYRRTPSAAVLKEQAFNLERLVGGRIFMFVGALVLVTGAALSLKLAWDQGWFALLPDQFKCLAVAAFGVVLLGAGEMARRRISPAASIGFSAAGIGVIYAAAFAAYGAFNLVSHEIGFLLMVGTTALGVFIGARAQLVSIAALALIAGYLTPLLFLDIRSSPYVLPAYLLSLLAVGLVLCGWRGGKYGVLRGLSWWGTVLFGTAWILLPHAAGAWVVFTFLILTWSGIHAELLYSAFKRRLTETDAHADVRPADLASRWDSWRSIRPLASSFTSTAWATSLSAITLLDIGRPMWIAPAVACVIVTVLTIPLGGVLRAIGRVPANDLQRLAAVLITAASGLLIAAIALAFADWMEIVAWLLLGVAAISAGQWIRSRSLDVYGLAVLGLATTRLAMFDTFFFRGPAAQINLLGISVSRLFILLSAGALAWTYAGIMLRRSSPPDTTWSRLSNAVFGIAITVQCFALVNEANTLPQAAWIILGGAATLLLVGTMIHSAGLHVYALVIQTFLGVMLLVNRWWRVGDADILAQPAGFIITRWTPIMFAAGLLFIVFAVARKRLERAERNVDIASAPAVYICSAVGFVMMMISIVHIDTSFTGVTLAWLALSIAVWCAHRGLPALALRAQALLISVAATATCLIAGKPASWLDSAAPMLLHHGLLLALGTVAVQFTLSMLTRRTTPHDRTTMLLSTITITISVGVALLFSATSLEVARIARMVTEASAGQRAAVSIWWGIFAIGLLVVGMKRRIAELRRIGLGLLAVATGKAVVFDLTDVSAGWRVASFLVLGLIMLAVAVVYAKVNALRGDPEPADSAGNSPKDDRTPAAD